MKKILFLIVILIFMGMWFFIPKFVEIPKEIQITEFDKNTSVDIILPQGSHYFFSLGVQKNIYFSGELKVLHKDKIIYTTKINNKNLKNAYYPLMPEKIALNIFHKNKKYKFIFTFYKKPSTNIKLILNYLSHW